MILLDMHNVIVLSLHCFFFFSPQHFNESMLLLDNVQQNHTSVRNDIFGKLKKSPHMGGVNSNIHYENSKK